MLSERVKQFLLPKMTRIFGIRLAAGTACAYVVFGHVCVLTWVHGASMEPTYRDGRINFCWRLRYLRSAPKVGDVVMTYAHAYLFELSTFHSINWVISQI